MEGVPVRDAFGKSDNFRRPGYAITSAVQRTPWPTPYQLFMPMGQGQQP
jgi:hypothetical protein